MTSYVLITRAENGDALMLKAYGPFATKGEAGKLRRFFVRHAKALKYDLECETLPVESGTLESAPEPEDIDDEPTTAVDPGPASEPAVDPAADPAATSDNGQLSMDELADAEMASPF